MATPAEQHFGPDRLQRMGLRTAPLHTALLRGHFAALNCTRHHPVTAAGLYMWAEATKELRDLLIPDGWETSDEENIPKTVSPDGSLCIVVVSGNEATGNPHRDPATRHARGSAGVRDIRSNHQLWLFDSVDVGRRKARGQAVWYLLHYATEEWMRCELSQPILANDSGHVEGWRERIILPAIDLTDASARNGGGPDGPELDVPVTPRAR